MPYGRRKRTYRRPRKFTRRKRFSRRGTVRTRRGQKVYYFKRNGNLAYERALDGTANATVNSRGVATDSINVYAFRATDIPNFSEFASLYDQFRIKAIKFSAIPIGNVSTYTGTTGATGTTPTYSVRSYSVLDFQYDASSPTTVSQLREYQNCKWKPYNRIHSRYFYPRLQLSSDGNDAQYTVGSKPWVSTQTASQQAQWAGIIFGVDGNSAPTGTILYQIELKYYLQFRTVK